MRNISKPMTTYQKCKDVHAGKCWNGSPASFDPSATVEQLAPLGSNDSWRMRSSAEPAYGQQADLLGLI